MAANRKFVLLWAFFVGAVAVPVSKKEQCARYCTEGDDFLLQPGHTYTYDYETTTVTAVQGSYHDRTQLQLTAQVDIEVLSKCDLSLKLRGVTLKLSDPESPDYLNAIRGARDFAKSIERHILRFSFQNGKVEHVCPTENVPTWVLNIQKGVLSAFQTFNVKPDYTVRAMETDVLGKCTAEYHSLGTSWQGTHTIRKLKDLSTCTDRENVETYLQGTPYADFEKKSLPMVKGTQECEQIIGDSFLKSSTCSEKLVFRPFSNGGSSVITTVTQKLSYATISQRSFTGNDYRPTTESLLFMHEKQVEKPSRRVEDAEEALKDLCESAKDDISIFVPRKFSAFVYKLKKLPVESLRSFYQNAQRLCPGNSKARKFFMDAIPLVATSDSAKFMYDMISRKTISESESKFWLTSLSFISEPTADIISTLTPLLDGQHEQALLGVSSLIHTFCKSNDCSRVTEVERSVNRLVQNLGENCYSPDDKKIILTLKALSNIGFMFGRENVLEACYKNPQVRTEARLAAIQAFRRVSCEISREDLLATYSNYNEDSEIRIASYLAVMSCPSSSTVQSVRDVLMKETINHVGSFVWTHLTALAKSKHPERKDLREIVTNLYLLNKYQPDVRKFSSAHEATFFLQSIDSGFHVDSHLIFSTDSYLPKSAMFNLTVDVFGKTCNLFQVDGRMEGLERVVESFFGPSGYFPQKNIASLLREKRSISNNKIDDLDEKFQAKSQFRQDPYGSLDVKVFGSSLWYTQFKENGDGSPDINLLEVVTKLAEEQEKEYSRSFMFLDTTFTIPMTSGLPLRFAVNGTASVGLKIGGRLDVKSMQHVDVSGNIEPSGAIEIAGLLTVDAGTAARSGLRVVGTMHSSTVLNGKVEVRNGEIAKFQLNMPRDRIDVFNMQSKLYIVHGPNEREQKVDKKEGALMKSCSGDTTSRILGVKFCSELQLPPYKPNSYLHPVNGPATLSLYIQKTDKTLKSYDFDAQWRKGERGRYGLLSLNTPSSEIDRDIRLEMLLNEEDHTATLKLKTPVKKLGVNVKFLNEVQRKLDVGITVDDKDYFSLQADLQNTEDKDSVTYSPSLEIRVPSRRLAAVSGSVYLKRGQKYTGQLQIDDLTTKPILAKGNFEIGKRGRYEGEISLSSFAIDGTVKGYAQAGDSMSARINAEYKFLEGKTNKISMQGKIRNLSANALIKYNGVLNFQTSTLPEWNTELAFETMQTTGHVENSVTISLGDGVRSRMHKIMMQKIVKYEGDFKNHKVEASFNLVYPEKNINYALQLSKDVKISEDNSAVLLKDSYKLQYDTNKQVNVDLFVDCNYQKARSLTGDLKVNYPGRDAGVRVELRESQQNEYIGSVSCQWQTGKVATATILYKDRSESKRLKYEIESRINLPSRSPIVMIGTVALQQGWYTTQCEINTGLDKYRAKGDISLGNGLNHRMAGQFVKNNDLYGLDASIQNVKNKLNTQLEIKMPNHYRIASKFEGKMDNTFKTCTFETLWDADRDTSKRFVFNGEVRNQNDGYDGKFTMQVRRRTIAGSMKLNLQGEPFSSEWRTDNKLEIEWSPSEKAAIELSSNVLLRRSRWQINNHVEITTPYYGYENLTFSLDQMYSDQQWDTELSTLLPGKTHLAFLSTGKYSFLRDGATIEALAKLQSSWKRMKDVSFELFHEHSTNELSSKAQLNWENDRAVVQISGINQQSNIKAALKMNAPFKYLQDLSAELTHSMATNNYKTNGKVQWAARKTVSFDFEGLHTLSGRRRICSVSIKTLSPFRGYENGGLKVTYSNDPSAINTDAEISWNQNAIKSSLSTSLRSNLHNKHFEGKLQVTSPFRNYENVHISTSFESNRDSYKVNVEAQLPHRSTTSINSLGKMPSLNDLELNAVVIGSFPKYGEPIKATIDFVHKLQNSNLRTSLDTAYGSKRITLQVQGLNERTYGGKNLEFSVIANTPFDAFEEMKMELAHHQLGNDFDSNIRLSKNEENAHISHKLSLRDSLNFETTFEMVSNIVPNTKITMFQSNNGGQLEHKTDILHNKKRMNLNAQFFDKSFLKEFSFKLNTPFRNVREIDFKSSYESQNWEHKGMVSAVWDRINKVTLSGDLRNYRWENVNAQVEFTSSFNGYEFYSTSAKYDLTAPQKSFEFSHQWDINNRKAIIAKGEFLRNYRLTKAQFSLNTPFEDVNKVKFEVTNQNSPSERNLVLEFYVKGRQNANLNFNFQAENEIVEMSYNFANTFRTSIETRGSAKYTKNSNGKTVTINNQWNKGKLFEIIGQYELNEQDGKLQVSASTPMVGYEQLSFEISGKLEHSGVSSQVVCRWGTNSEVLIDGHFLTQHGGSELLINAKTTFRRYRQISFKSEYKLVPGLYEGSLLLTVNQRNVYRSKVNFNYGGEKMLLKFDMDSPNSEVKNIQLTSSLELGEEAKALTAYLKWNNDETKLELSLTQKDQQYYELKARLDTPFENYKLFSFDSSLTANGIQLVNGRMNVITPFRSLRNLDVSCNFKTDDTGFFILIEVHAPGKDLKVEGKLSNRQFKPFSASVDIQAPFMSFMKISNRAEINLARWNDVKVKFISHAPHFAHAMGVELVEENNKVRFDLKLDSSALRSQKGRVALELDYANTRNIKAEGSIELFNEVHYIASDYTDTGREMRVEVRMESPLLPERKLEVTGVHITKRSNKMESQISFTVPSSLHQITTKYESSRSQMMASMKIDSDILPFSTLDSQIKYVNNNYRDMKTELLIKTPESSHSAILDVKNYPGEKFAQIKIECPFSAYLNPFSITGSFKNDNYEAMDGSLSLSSMGKEIRIAGNMKKERWENMEAFFTINTPFQALQMVRVNGNFVNDKYQNLACNFDMESSNPNLRYLGVTSKLSRSKGAEDMSLMLRLPLKNYQTIQLLASGHYAADFSSADSRLTLTLASKKYSVYGQYGVNAPRVSGTLEYETGNTKWKATGRLERTNDKNDVTVSFTFPNTDRYTFGGAYGGFENQRYVAASYIAPNSEKYNVNSSVKFTDLTNFEAEMTVETPFESYRNLQGNIQQQYNSNFLSTNVEFLKNGRKGFFKMLHRVTRNAVLGTFQMGCPYSKVRDIKLTYNHDTKSTDKECSLELEYNRMQQFKAQLMRFGKKSTHLILDSRALPLTMTADIKHLSTGKEVNFKSDYYNRVISFRSSYKQEQGQLLHDAAFTWDERAEKRVSYDFKLVDTDSGKELWSRLDTPVRSLMLKGNFTKTNRARSGGVDFYWDAGRSLEKRMAIGLEHTDMSKSNTEAHRIQLTMEHPKLKREIVQTNTISFSSTEFHLKSELLYSRERNNNFMMELKANNLAKNSRDTHYKGDFRIRHPTSRLDIRAIGEMMDSKIESSAFLKFNNLDSRQSQNIREVRAKIFKIRQQIELLLKSNENEINVFGQATGTGGDMNISIEKKLNEKNGLTTQIHFSRRNKALDISVINSENTGVQVSAAFPKESASLKVTHSNRGDVTTDVHVFLRLEESKILKSQLSWRPRLWRELRIVTGETIRAILSESKERSKELSNAFSEEWNFKSSIISRHLTEELSPLFDDVKLSMNEIAADYRVTKNAFWTMYRRNEFYMQDIVRGYETTKEILSDTMGKMALVCEVLCNVIMEKLEDLYDRAYYFCLDMMDYASELKVKLIRKASILLENIQEKLRCVMECSLEMLESGTEYIYKKLEIVAEKITMKLEKLVRMYAPCLIDGYFYTKQFADKIRYTVNNIVTKTSDCIFGNRYYIAISNYLSNVMDTIQAFRDYEYSASAQAFLNNIYDMEIIDTVVNHPNVEYMSGIANMALRKSLEIYHQLGMDVAVSAASESVSNYVKTMMLSTAQDFFTELYDMKGGVKHSIDLQRGLISMELTLPSSRNSLVEVFDFKSYPEYQKVLSMQHSLISEYYEDFCIWDFYYKFMKYFTPSYWLPSFKAHAVLSGNQHYITFDKLPFEFAGQCSYLLARDFVDGNFSVVVNYGDDHMRKSLTILTEGKKIDIANDYKITLDGIKAESPFQIGKTVVIREGTNIKIENEKKGFSVVCNFVHNYCRVLLSGFYFGKTGGLFGTYNYEPKLDMMTPTRHIANDLESFANSWEVGQTVCRSSENFATIPSNDYRVQERCRGLFEKSSSEFRACFKQVDPKLYMKMCVSDLSVVHQNRHEEALCQSAAAYFHECKNEGVPLKMPTHCVRCEKQDGSTLREGDAMKFPREIRPTAADVVLLVEEKECNRDRVKYLSKLAQSIEDNFRQKNYQDIRYSVVAFGGDDIHAMPHVHTMDGQESGPLRSLDSSIQSLEFGYGPNNILEALRFAAALNFRPGTTKTFVLLKCSACNQEEVKAEYGEMLRTLLDGDITLHILMEQKFEMKEVPNKNSKARKVIGVDKKFAYTLKDVKSSDTSGDGDLLAQLRIPKDVCIPLAFEVGGSNFEAQFLTDTRKNTNKKFIDVMARVVVRSSIEEEKSHWGMCCECIATEHGVGKSTCQRCVSAEVASMISGDMSGINNIPSSSTESREKSKSRVRKHKERRSGL